MNCIKAFNAVILALTTAAAILACGPKEVNAQATIGSVQLINVAGDRVIISMCSGPNGDQRGPGYVDYPGYQYINFEVNALSKGWTCDFVWESSAEGGRKYTASVLVWQGLLKADAPEQYSLITSLIPCINCIWKIQKDAFYRAEVNNHDIFHLMARWNSH